LFAADALEWKAAQEAASAAAQPGADGESVAPVNAEFDYAETTAETPTEPAPSETQEAGVDPATASETASEPHAEAVSEADAEPAAEAQIDPEAKRLARQQDREVRAILRGLLDELIATYASDDRGIEIKEIAGGYRMATKPECHDAARMFVKSLKPALKLSLPALETLAVIAYKQPVTAPEVNEIRGVDSSGVFGSLLARKLIATAGRKQVIGRPILYKTTKEFLLRFGLKDVNELPSMDEFEKMAQLEFEDMEPVAEGEASEVSMEGPEVDDDPDEPSSVAPEEKTAATADSEETPEAHAASSAPEAEPTPAEAAPAAPSTQEQAETETVLHD
jgi:segregation and condensation protein B